MAKSFAGLKADALVIKNEVEESKNTAARIGTMFADVVEKMEKVESETIEQANAQFVGNIVNNLTDGGADKALSAEMGKELAKEATTERNGLMSAYDKKMFVNDIGVPSVVNFNNYERLPYRINFESWELNSFYKHVLIPVEYLTGGTIKITANANKRTDYCLLKSNDTSLVDFATGWTQHLQIRPSLSKEIDVPADAKYLYVYIGSADESFIPSEVLFLKQGTLRTEIDDIKGRFPISPKDTTFFIPSLNVVDWFNIDIRDWSLNSTAVSTSYKSTDFIKLKANTTYTINQQARRVYTFQNSGRFEDSVYQNDNSFIQSFENIKTFNTGDIDTYARFTFGVNVFDIDSIMLVEGDEVPDEYTSPNPKISPTFLMLPESKSVKKITAIGSSGLALSSGGQWMLSDKAKEMYGVTSDLTVTRVLQVLLGYDEANIVAIGGNTASNSMFLCGLTCYYLNNSFEIKADGTTTTYEWNTDSISAQMTESINTIGNIKENASFPGMINGVTVYVDPKNSIISKGQSLENNVVIPAGSALYRKPSKVSIVNGVIRDKVQDSHGLVIQIGANDEGATPEELINYIELLVKASNCKWFICLPKNGEGLYTTSELNNAIPLMRKKYGSRYIDHRPYMCSLQVLNDMGIVPTTSEDYPDKNGLNSNPLTSTQIANNVPCDMQCIAQGKYPSSLWHSAFRDGETNNQVINKTHFNAIGLEALGKYLYSMIKVFGFDA